MLDRSRKSKAALRSARSRRRQRLGLRVILVEIDEWKLVDALIARRVLTEAEGLDPDAVSLAASRILDAWVRSP
jgi:hypothetical protein